MLLSLPEIRASLDIETSDKDDELLRAGSAVTRMMETYVGRPLEPKDVTEIFYGPRPLPVWLQGFPVIDLVSVQYNGVPVSGYRLNVRTGRLWQPNFEGYLTANDELTVTYRAGFSPMPDDLKHVFLEAVKLTRLQQDRSSAVALPDIDVSTGPTIRSIAIPDAISVQYDNSGGTTSATSSAAGNVWADTPIGPFVAILNSYRSEKTYGSFG